MGVKIRAYIIKDGKGISGYVILKDNLVIDCVDDITDPDNWKMITDKNGNMIDGKIDDIDTTGFDTFLGAGITIKLQ